MAEPSGAFSPPNGKTFMLSASRRSLTSQYASQFNLGNTLPIKVGGTNCLFLIKLTEMDRNPADRCQLTVKMKVHYDNHDCVIS